MAQTGYTPIQLYYSSTTTNVPLAANLAAGELAINTADGKLFYKDSGGVVRVIAQTSSVTNVASISFGSTGLTPSTATTGAVTVAGTLATTNGGTGLTSFTANGVVYASSSSVLTTGSALSFDGTNLNAGGGTSVSATSGGSFTGGLVAVRGALTAHQTATGVLQYTGNETTLRSYGATGVTGSLVFNLGAGGAADAEFMRLTSTGLGIGTSSPAAKLQVTAATASGTSGADGARFNAGGNVAINIGADSNTGYGWIQSANWGSGYINTAINPNGGNVGIGTSSPATKLHIQATTNTTLTIQGDASAGSTFINLSADSNATKAQISAAKEGASGGRLLFSYANSAGSVTEGMRLDSSGNLGLGVTPSAWDSTFKSFEIGAVGNSFAGQNAASQAVMSSNAYYSGGWKYARSTLASQFALAGGQAIWYTAPSGTAGNAISFTQAMTLDASGNLLVGGTSASFFSGSGVEIARTGVATLRLNSTTGGKRFEIQQDGSTAITTLNAADSASQIAFATVGTERARIDSSGNLLVGTTSTFGGGTGNFYVTKTGDVDLASFWSQSSAGNGTAQYIRRTNTGNFVYFVYGTSTGVGSISTNGTTTSYNITSDQRLKQNIQDADSASALIDSLQVRQYDWKSDGTHQRYGFVAQELVTVAPEAVHQPADPKQMMAVDYSKLVPMLVKEIQSLRARVAQLEAK